MVALEFFVNRANMKEGTMARLQDVLLNQFAAANSTLDFTIQDLSMEQLHHIAEGATIGSPASIYFHVAVVEDMVVSIYLKGGPILYDAGNWGEIIPTTQPHRGPSSMEWARTIRYDNIQGVRAYVAAVREQTRTYIESLTDEDFDRQIDFFTGPTAQVNVLTWLAWNTANHTGEIAAIRGLSGMKGLPY